MKIVSIVLLTVCAAAGLCAAEFPAELVGTWVLNKEASTVMIKTSPKWDDKQEAMLPRVLERRSAMEISIRQDSMTIVAGEREFGATLEFVYSVHLNNLQTYCYAKYSA